MGKIYTLFAMMLIATGQAQAATPDFQGIWGRVSSPASGYRLRALAP
jgi:hypothetical protein